MSYENVLLGIAAVCASIIFASPIIAFGLSPGGAILAIVFGVGGMVGMTMDKLAAL
jgi:hypothetical protein